MKRHYYLRGGRQNYLGLDRTFTRPHFEWSANFRQADNFETHDALQLFVGYWFIAIGRHD
jgi:hypothetical protein